MQSFMIVLLLCPIIQISYSIPCLSIPPGLDRLTHGIDITSFEFFPSDITGENGFERDVFDFTCDKKLKWKNPYTNVVYDLPDQIKSITLLPQGIDDNKVEVMHTYEEAKRAQSNRFNINYSYGMFSTSESSAKNMEVLNQKFQTLMSVSAFVSAYVVELNPGEVYGGLMKQFHDTMLPNTYQENTAKYQEFIETFGTNYLMTASFGGLIKVDIETDGMYASRTTGQILETQAKNSFNNFLSLSGAHPKGSGTIDKTFQLNSHIKESYYGGTANLINMGPNGFQTWWESAKRMPWIFGGKLAIISDLLPNGPKKTAVNTAITVKICKAALEEMSLSLETIKKYSFTDVAAANNLVNQVNALKAQPIPVFQTVSQLGTAVDQFVNAQKLIKRYCLTQCKCENLQTKQITPLANCYITVINKQPIAKVCNVHHDCVSAPDCKCLPQVAPVG